MIKPDQIELKWTYYPSEKLYKKCRPIADDEIASALEVGEMMKDMLDEKGGVGLAANQAGLDLCMAIVAFPDDDGEFRELKTLINPEIVFKSPNLVTGEEGCLSFPELFVEIERPSEVIVRTYLEGEGMTSIQARGYLARIFSHEIDHLNGITMPDRLNPINREIIQPYLDKIEEEFGNQD